MNDYFITLLIIAILVTVYFYRDYIFGNIEQPYKKQNIKIKKSKQDNKKIKKETTESEISKISKLSKVSGMSSLSIKNTNSEKTNDSFVNIDVNTKESIDSNNKQNTDSKSFNSKLSDENISASIELDSKMSAFN